MDAGRYPTLSAYTSPLRAMQRELVGRDDEIAAIMAAFSRPELCNVILLAPAGAGKTSVVQGCMQRDRGRLYLEVDLARMIANLANVDEMAAKLKMLFDEASEMSKAGRETVLFIDEFHQIVQLSDAAVEALKPLLADSGTRGIRVVAATTFAEFREHIAPNQPLVERLHRINLAEPDEDTCVAIMKGMAERYNVAGLFHDDSLFRMIYEYTNRYVPSNAQPRKSILMLDAMVGWHRTTGAGMTQELLAKCIYESEGVNVAMSVDAATIKEELDSMVYDQQFATASVAKRLQLCVADLNDKSRPMASLLLTGATGCGKAFTNDSEMVVRRAGERYAERITLGELKAGDIVYNVDGVETCVGGVFPQEGDLTVWKVTFEDEQVCTCAGDHLWRVGEVTCDGEGEAHMRFRDHDDSTEVLSAMMAAGLSIAVPLCAPVRFPERDDLTVQPYQMGFMLASFGMQGIDEAEAWKHVYASIEQRQQFWQGVCAGGNGRIRQSMDAIGDMHSGYTVCVPLSVLDVVCSCIRSMGWKAIPVGEQVRATDKVPCERIQVYGSTEAYGRMCTTVDAGIACGAAMANGDLPEEGFLRIRSIERTEACEPMTCIWLDEPVSSAHLYLTGDYIVTHNTELTKQLAKILFDDNDRSLIRFDMSEYANADSLDRFRAELTERVWAKPYSVILLDEIEKGCAEVSRLLLQVLDDGRLVDVNGRVVSFVNSYVVMTTNAGSEVYKGMASYTDVDPEKNLQTLAHYDALIRRSLTSTTGANNFPPELLGRIDTIVPFQPLSLETRRRIARTKLTELKERVLELHGVRLAIDEKVIDYLVEDQLTTDSDAGGARAVISKMDSEVTCAVAAFINANPHAKRVGVKVEGTMRIEDKSKLASEARICVFASKV